MHELGATGGVEHDKVEGCEEVMEREGGWDGQMMTGGALHLRTLRIEIQLLIVQQHRDDNHRLQHEDH